MLILGKCFITELIVFLVCWLFTSVTTEDSPSHTFFACIGMLAVLAMIVTFLGGVWIL